MVCYFIKPSPTQNISQKKKSLNTERNMHLSNMVLLLASMFVIALAAPHDVSTHSSTSSTHV